MLRYVIRTNMNKHVQLKLDKSHSAVILRIYHVSLQPVSPAMAPPQKSQTYFKYPHENHEIRGCLAAVFLGQVLHLPLSKLRNQLKLSSFHGRRLLRSLATKEEVPFSQSLKAWVLRGNRYQSAWWICPKLAIYLGTQTTLSVLTRISSKKSMHRGTHFCNVLLPQNIAIRLGRNGDMKPWLQGSKKHFHQPGNHWNRTKKKPMSNCPPRVHSMLLGWHHLTSPDICGGLKIFAAFIPPRKKTKNHGSSW